jgi:hypothetical protein
MVVKYGTPSSWKRNCLIGNSTSITITPFNIKVENIYKFLKENKKNLLPSFWKTWRLRQSLG